MIKYYYGPRQCGKTTMLLNEFMHDPANSLIICRNGSMVSYMMDTIRSRSDRHRNTKHDRNVITVAKAISPSFLGTYTKILLDEFDFFNEDKSELISKLSYHLADNGEICIYTTPSYLRDAKLFTDAQKINQCYGSYLGFEVHNPGLKHIESLKLQLSSLKEMCSDPATWKNTKLIRLPGLRKYDQKKEIQILGETNYQTEILGDLYGTPIERTNKDWKYDISRIAKHFNSFDHTDDLRWDKYGPGLSEEAGKWGWIKDDPEHFLGRGIFMPIGLAPVMPMSHSVDFIHDSSPKVVNNYSLY